MDVRVVECTENPVWLIGMLAGISHGKTEYDAKAFERRTRFCIGCRHDSVLEHVSATFIIEGISRACSHQLVRHRLASFVERSQRFVEPDFHGDWYVNPFKDGPGNLLYLAMMDRAMRTYISLRESGVPAEDARFVLPEATKTDVVVTVNLRELDHMRDERCTDGAQWEIRETVNRMWERLSGADGWHDLLEMLDTRRMS